MAVSYKAPGVYVEEVKSGVRTITGVGTSITAFLGRALRGPVDSPTRIFGYADYERHFGGLWTASAMSQAVQHFYLNGGGEALIVRLTSDDALTASTQLVHAEAWLGTTAAATGATGFHHVSVSVADGVDAEHFEMTVEVRDELDAVIDDGGPLTETLAMSIDPDAPDSVATVIAGATFVELVGAAPEMRPANVSDVQSVPVGGPGVVTLATVSTAWSLDVEARSHGDWGDRIRVSVEHPTGAPASKFTFREREVDDAGNELFSETYYNVSLDPDDPRYLPRLLETASSRVGVGGTPPSTGRPGVVTDQALTGGGDGSALEISDYEGSAADKTGLHALDKADLFNLLCIPLSRWSTDDADPDFGGTLWDAATTYCETRRAVLLLDPPAEWTGYQLASTAAPDFQPRHANAALYFPRIRVPDPLKENRLGEFPPCGAVAGLIARTDAQRGVWKAPAGTEASLRAVRELTVDLNDDEQGTLNQVGVNCLRTFPVYGRVVWGARTLKGADVTASEWKYLPVRRLALYLEESLYRGTQWAVFEPNDEPLWSQLRLNIGAFLQQLFRQGAFQGSSPREAYFVKCDRETTTQADIDRGVVNVVVGFAPLKPAEFVIIHIQQMAAQAE